MKKIFLYVINMLFVTFCCFSNDFIENRAEYYMGIGDYYYYESVTFLNDDEISFESPAPNYDYDLWENVYKYTTDGNKGYYKVIITRDGEKRKLHFLTSKLYLIIYNESIKEPIFVGSTKYRTHHIETIRNITATSCLTEGEIEYGTENLTNLLLDSPWCEGVFGYGKNESITFTTKTPFLVFFSGYFSIKKNYLFERNSRPKVIEVFSETTNKTKTIYLNDTPAPQELDLRELFDKDEYYWKENMLIFTIKDIYKGTFYTDTCINSIMEGCVSK